MVTICQWRSCVNTRDTVGTCKQSACWKAHLKLSSHWMSASCQIPVQQQQWISSLLHPQIICLVLLYRNVIQLHSSCVDGCSWNIEKLLPWAFKWDGRVFDWENMAHYVGVVWYCIWEQAEPIYNKLNPIGANRPETPKTVPELERLSRVPPGNENSLWMSRISVNPQANIGSQGSKKVIEFHQMYGNNFRLLQTLSYVVLNHELI